LFADAKVRKVFHIKKFFYQNSLLIFVNRTKSIKSLRNELQ
jgi:hypothetical protein